MIKQLRPYCAALLLLLSTFTAFECRAKVDTISGVIVEFYEHPDGTATAVNVWNGKKGKVDIYIDSQRFTIKGGSSYQFSKAKKEGLAKRVIEYTSPQSGSGKFWVASATDEPVAPITPVAEEKVPEVAPAAATAPAAPDPKKEKETAHTPQPQPEASPVSVPAAKPNLSDVIHRDAYFGEKATAIFVQQMDSLCEGLSNSKNQAQYIIDNDITQLLDEANHEIADQKTSIAIKAQELLNMAGISESNQNVLLPSVIETLTNKLNKREAATGKLAEAVASVKADDNAVGGFSTDDIINYAIMGVIILLVVALMIFVVKRKGKKNKKTKGATAVASAPDDSANPAIVVRRRTTSVLKKQCVDDAIDNPDYLLIKASEFTPDSAVRNIYVKNTCIKEVYNLYADDLRNTEKPKEDGCMVLGRWVYDEAARAYDITLEDVVFPGDDAVFKEYELNFGGKIKLRIAERLRKLRKDTNLQYDLVCWIHSHPGLGVFFSNSDDNVQMQLKHPQHPNFLIAFVVDILTSNQEMGIFTFRQDGSMNSKGDLTKMYSLEELYKWAIQSHRTSYNPDNYFNVLANAKLKLPTCNGIQLDNNSIIDITQVVVEAETGIVGWAIGANVDKNGSHEVVVSDIVKDEQRPAAGTVGCLINATQMSLPTVQRLVGRNSAALSFVMVYSANNASLITIPVINGELLTDEQFYGNVNIDDLKIWTRRKR